MKRLLTIIIEQEISTNGDERNEVRFIPGRLSTVEVRKAGIIERLRQRIRHRMSLKRNIRSPVNEDTNTSVSVAISAQQYGMLMRRLGRTNMIGHTLAFVPASSGNDNIKL